MHAYRVMRSIYTGSRCRLLYGDLLNNQGVPMSVGTILLIVLVLLLIGVLPTWGHSRSCGYGPSGGLGLVLVIVLVLLLMGRI